MTVDYKAKAHEIASPFAPEFLITGRFCELVSGITAALQEIVETEREACAKTVEKWGFGIAEDIRNRGKTDE